MSFLKQIVFSRANLLWPVLAGLAAAYAASGLLAYKKGPQIHQETISKADPAQHREQSWEGIIFEKNILNLDIPDHKPPRSDPAQAASPDTWKLLAALTGTRNLALISADGEVAVVSPGQSLQGWELSAIAPGTATLKSGTRTRILRMWQDRESSQGVAPSPQSELSSRPGSKKISLASQEARPLLNNPNSLLQMAQFSPYDQDGEQGFEITNIQPESILQKLGFKNNDVLTRIDGRPITGPTELLKAYSSLAQSSLVTMDILRQGQNLNFVVEIN